MNICEILLNTSGNRVESILGGSCHNFIPRTTPLAPNKNNRLSSFYSSSFKGNPNFNGVIFSAKNHVKYIYESLY